METLCTTAGRSASSTLADIALQDAPTIVTDEEKKQ